MPNKPVAKLLGRVGAHVSVAGGLARCLPYAAKLPMVVETRDTCHADDIATLVALRAEVQPALLG